MFLLINMVHGDV